MPKTSKIHCPFIKRVTLLHNQQHPSVPKAALTLVALESSNGGTPNFSNQSAKGLKYHLKALPTSGDTLVRCQCVQMYMAVNNGLFTLLIRQHSHQVIQLGQIYVIIMKM